MIYDKDERKEYVMREADTAQTVFESYLDTLPKNTIELNIPESLNGTVDLGVFPSKGLTKIKHVFFFSPGQITSIVNIPKNLQSLHCNDNLLSELPDLPETLQILQVSNNMLTSINVYPCVQLKKLHISENRITSISGLPPSLIRLYCDHNQLTSLNLASTTLLTTLICNDNPQLVLENLPKTLLHVEYPTTIRQQHYVSTEIPSVEYIEQFNNFKNTELYKKHKEEIIYIIYNCKELMKKLKDDVEFEV
jgi:Leucine-rich repeat (LRR) protein